MSHEERYKRCRGAHKALPCLSTQVTAPRLLGVAGGGLGGGGLGVGSDNPLLVKTLEERLHNGTISDLSTSEGRELEPENEEGLEGEVPWEVVEDDAEGKGLDKVEETEDDPVSQPLNIILRSRGLEGLEGQVGGKSPTEEV